MKKKSTDDMDFFSCLEGMTPHKRPKVEVMLIFFFFFNEKRGSIEVNVEW